VLFVLIGLEVLLVTFTTSTLAAAALAMGVTLVARALTVGLPVALLPGVFRLPKGSGWVLTWGGLRGGISVALALSLPLGPGRDIVLTLTYCIVVFSILGQGLTIGWVVRKAVTKRD
jgi:CPA1 family monovalent cation:H+ antiporter